MRSWYDVTKLKKCPVFSISENRTGFIMFGPDLSTFKQFSNLESLLAYAEQHSLILDFKNGV